MDTQGKDALQPKKKGRLSMKKETANQPKKLPVEGSTEALQARINQLEIKRIAIVTGQPIKRHKNSEKEMIINMV